MFYIILVLGLVISAYIYVEFYEKKLMLKIPVNDCLYYSDNDRKLYLLKVEGNRRVIEYYNVFGDLVVKPAILLPEDAKYIGLL